MIYISPAIVSCDLRLDTLDLRPWTYSGHLPENCDQRHNEARANRTMKVFAVHVFFDILPRWIWI